MAKAQKIAKKIPALAPAGMQVNFTGWDFCSAQGPMISPMMFRNVIEPALKIIVDAAHKAGMYYFYSSDGNFWPVANEMFNEIGVDGWFEVDKSGGMELSELRKKFPKTTFIGNIRSQILHHGTKQDVINEVLSCIDTAHTFGGIIIGVSNMIMPQTPDENIFVMLTTIEKYR